ncbi:Hypothetical_protein [Hexamita inflata]|uniref:Hypothetical_protein n=1 Tax=Hexamita inflata TaxID=28002 RepID=A0AA86TJC5_9EUKA|nr:Hypothetical protein HINF_LOCUS8099 [Hexamita inflata]
MQDKQNNSPITSHNLLDKILEQQNQIKDKSNSVYKKLKTDEASESTSLRDNLSIVPRRPKSPQSSEQRASQKVILQQKFKQEIVPMQRKLYALQYKKIQSDEKMILERQRNLLLDCDQFDSEFSEMSETARNKIICKICKIEENQSNIRKSKLMQKTAGFDTTEELKQEIATLKQRNESYQNKIAKLLESHQKITKRQQEYSLQQQEALRQQLQLQQEYSLQQQKALINRVQQLEYDNLCLLVNSK